MSNDYMHWDGVTRWDLICPTEAMHPKLRTGGYNKPQYYMEITLFSSKKAN